MSKDLAFNENANIAWDLHEANENIPLAFTEENAVNVTGVETTVQEQALKGLKVYLAERDLLDKEFDILSKEEITSENISKFKELRLKYVKNRTQGTNKWHEKESEVSLRYKQFLDAKKRSENAINESREEVLFKGEKFFENQEKEKARLLNEERIEKVRPYVEDVTGLDFSPMNDEDFDDYVLGKKTRYNERIEAEKQMKIEAEKEAIILKLHNERSATLLPYWNFILEADKDRNWGAFDEETFQSCLKMYQERKNVFDAENEKIRVENARLQKEAEAKEKELEKERAEAKAKQDAIELKAKKEREKAESERKIEADKKDAEIKRLKDEKEKSENERITKEKEAKELAKAPVKKQLSVWVNSFELPNTEVENELSKEIKDKFEAFKKWSLTQINNL